MTREDIKTIIDIVHETIYGFFDVCDEEETPMTDKDKLLLKINKAICTNIKALKQEPSGDLISRQAVIDACEQSINILEAVDRIMDLPFVEQEPCEDAISRDAVLEKAVYTETEEGWCGYTVDVDYIKSLPPVKQEPKTGHWIEDDMTYCGVDLTNYKCDKCGEIGGAWRKGLKPDKLPKYCMNCGAKMVEPQERSE